MHAETGLFYQWIFKWKKVLDDRMCTTLCDPMDSRLPGCSVHGILQERILEWVYISYSRGSSWPRDGTWVSCLAGRFSTIWATREAQLQILWRKLPKRWFHLYWKSGIDESVRYAWIICITGSMDMSLVNSGSGDGQGDQACCGSWVKKSRTQLSDWTELNWTEVLKLMALKKELNHYEQYNQNV